MSFYVYILRSAKTGRYYCGQTNAIEIRLQKHNQKEVTSTQHGVPWELVGYVERSTRTEAMQLEKQIKKRGIERWLVDNETMLKR